MLLLICGLVGKHRVWWHSAAALFWWNILITAVEGKQMAAHKGCFSDLQDLDMKMHASLLVFLLLHYRPCFKPHIREECKRVSGFFSFSLSVGEFLWRNSKHYCFNKVSVNRIRVLWGWEIKQAFKFCEVWWLMDGRQCVWIENHKTWP